MLIANRGEIAVRIARACRELGVTSVAIFSEADRAALHVRIADEAYPAGPAPAAQSYLNIARIVEIARGCGAQAVHPGYGFLSENADFAAACAAAGLVFVGPSALTIEAMGDKVIARQRMQAAGVPIVPGSTDELSDDEALAFARAIGLPVMVKATAGGGGRGLRLVRDEADLPAAIQRARSEAKSSFGHDAIYVEKFVEQPRHVEIQILGDAQGNVVHLFERECSIQRRHQKLIEEAPANRMTPALRAAMGRAAVAAAKEVDYVGAGTCEFLVDANNDFYFLEMNTRVQVEHPVTELVTGVDIVKTGLRIAAGEPLGFVQDDVRLEGWAIECRIYAEDPDKAFRPSPGTIALFRPPSGPGVRDDSGVATGSEVPVHYDALLSKLVTWGHNRQEAVARMRRALAEFAVLGVRTTIPFHQRVLANPVFLSGRFDTGFIDAEIAPAKPEPDTERRRAALLLAALACAPRAKLTLDKAVHEVEVAGAGPGRFDVTIDGAAAVRVDAARIGRAWSLLLDGRQLEGGVEERANGRLDVRVGTAAFDLVVARS